MVGGGQQRQWRASSAGMSGLWLREWAAAGVWRRRGESVCNGRSFQSGRYPELVQDVRDVDSGGLLADHKGLGDLAVRAALRDELEDLRLSWGQPEQLP